jgi:hypothetical protein
VGLGEIHQAHRVNPFRGSDQGFTSSVLRVVASILTLTISSAGVQRWAMQQPAIKSIGS